MVILKTKKLHYKWEFYNFKQKQIKCKNKSLTNLTIAVCYPYNFKDLKVP